MERVDVTIICHCSVSLGLQFKVQQFDVMLVPTHDVDDSIRRITEAQNSKGLRAIGWCRAPKETDQTKIIQDNAHCLWRTRWWSHRRGPVATPQTC